MNSTTEIERVIARGDDAPSFSLSEADGHMQLIAKGNWTLKTVTQVDQRLKQELSQYEQDRVSYNFNDVTEMDTAGAYVLSRAIKCTTGRCFDWTLASENKGHDMLIQAAADARMGQLPVSPLIWTDVLVRIGVAD